MAAEDMKLRSDQACEAAEQFVKLYYEAYDKRRHIMNKFYMDNATLVWNGNGVNGPAEICKFLEALPTSTHIIEALDAQPVPSHATGGQTSILVTTSGGIKYDGNKSKTFTQNFMLTTQNNNWKVITDCMRTIEL